MDTFSDMAVEPRPVRRRRPRRLSEVFARLAAEADGPVTIGQIRDALGDRSFAALLVFFAAFNLLPLPPGASVILGAPLIIVSAQMVAGSSTAWLPRFLMRKSLSQAQFRALSERLIPRMVRLETLIRPRYWPFWRRRGDRVIGVIALILAIAVVLPVPLGNWLPAFATALVGLAMSERDGILFAIAVIVGIASLIVIALVIASAGAVLHLVFAQAGSAGWW
ncbi:exopolysaccharide biosynthesis protein [Nitratireductor sp. StC3]|uniref:exopolysaccharide biosynthesis protein n=1 Tax=Nitratireductor sp. StC3 TaxID=2126741 RepID=UPI000D0DE0A9|nr:exopolysaccharide biosynthesis protein [Nitratireductor sp. StC3]PSM17887.1 exopolysaccharide biosynthesis protein exod [Nitratireductor sp. StC3]